MPTQAYQEEYDKFIEEYTSGTTTGERVGEIIAHMAQHFTTVNLEFAAALKKYNATVASFEGTTDNSGKPISSTKAKSLADATSASDALIDSKAHIENVEQCINALKSLQKGILNEYSHVSQM